MWEVSRVYSLVSFIMRRISIPAAILLMSVIVPLLSLVTPVFADTATWKDGNIVMGSQTFTKVTPAPTLPGITEDVDVYSTPSEAGKDVSIITVPVGSDPTVDTSTAKIFTYTYDGQVYSNPRPPTGEALTVAAGTGADGVGVVNAEKSETSCAVTGIGWIICSISRWIADGMDHTFNMISGFLTVKPLSNDTSSGLYQAWNVTRGIANACFIIAFMLIIYAQLTSYGISNYEIKKMIPKLILAAILVNVSYYVCTVAVDLSNILGDSIQKALIQIRESLPSPMPGGSMLNWKSMTEFLLSGGTIAVAGIAGYAAFTGAAIGGSVTALVFMLFPILVSGLLSVLIALMVLAARQALITVLVIISPLAFVAYLLPNTEQYFTKWRQLLTTMLMIFPMFSLLYGGSQLASFIVIQNTDQISVVLLAMFIQVAPLALTPFLIKFSGSLLGQLSSMMNNPRRFLVGQTKEWAQDHSKTQAGKAQAAAANRGGTYFHRRAFRRNLDQKNRDGWKKLGEDYTDAVWHNDPRYRRHHTRSTYAEQIKKVGETGAERHLQEHHNPQLDRLIGQRRMNEDAVKMLEAREEARWQEAKTGKVTSATHPENQFASYSAESNNMFREQRIADSNAAIAQALQSKDYAVDLGKEANVELQVRAGGTVDNLGSIKVKAKALNEVIQAGGENVGYIKTASSVKAGDIKGMKAEIDKAVIAGDVDSLRAYTDMLAAAKDPGIKALREVINKHHDTIRTSDMHETYMHFLNSNATINAAAKDIGDYSRDVEKGYRKLSEITNSAKTWSNMDAMKFAEMKTSSQIEALKARDADGNWAISRAKAIGLMKSPMAWANIKPEAQDFIRLRAKGLLGTKINGKLQPFDTPDHFTNPPAQDLPPDTVIPDV